MPGKGKTGADIYGLKDMPDQKKLLSEVNTPEDLRKLSLKELKALASEIRAEIIKVVNSNGGHLSSNLGVVELSLALHNVFSSPKDKIIWDVGHQCYTHKLITGRKDSFSTLRLKDGLSGFPKYCESEHDLFETGHASTSISAALGILTGQQMLGRDGKVIAVIGDGALTGGMAFEALNHAGHLRKNLIIVLNDNNMAISRNVGALSKYSAHRRLSSYLSRITATRSYQNIRDRIDRGIKVVPALGYQLFELVVRLKKGIKAIFFKETIFSEFGFEYAGPIDGHNLAHLTQVFRAVKKLNRPVVVHVVTTKGKGFPQAEGDPVLYHGVSPVTLVDGKVEKKSPLTFTEAFSEALLKKAAEDHRIVAITAAMATGTGLAPFQDLYPDRFFDVGIAEQHALTFASGLASAGLKPVVPIYSTFIQRSVDQIIHDTALQKLPVVICLDRAGVVGYDGETHQGVYDISLFRSVPDITILAPAGAEELRLMLSYALDAKGPVIVRYPKAPCPSAADKFDAPLEPGRGSYYHHTKEDILLISVGGLFEQTLSAHEILWKENIRTDLYNPRFIKPIDEDYLEKVLRPYSSVFCFEDGSEQGGIGEYISAFVHKRRLNLSFFYKGVQDEFLSNASRDELLAECGLDPKGISGFIKSRLMGQLRVLRENVSGT